MITDLINENLSLRLSLSHSFKYFNSQNSLSFLLFSLQNEIIMIKQFISKTL